VADIGPGAAARLTNKNITPIKPTEPGAAIADVLERLIVTLNGNPPPWLRKALGQLHPDSTDEYLETEEEITV
jgi:nitrogen fixation protein NifX